MECEIKQGCLIRNLVCSCGLGCASDYRYDSMQECQASLRGKKNDLCKTSNPCMHGGTCIQISQRPGFRCRCEGTGFYGMKCNRGGWVFVTFTAKKYFENAFQLVQYPEQVP